MPKIPRSRFSKHYEKSAERHQERKQQMSLAVNVVIKNQMKIRAAATLYGVSKSALQRHLKIFSRLGDEEQAAHNFEQQHGFQRIFNTQEEKLLEEYLLDASNMCYGLTERDVRILAFNFAVANHKNIPPSWDRNKSAGKEWMFCFRKRHPKIALRTPEATSLTRATSFNAHNVSIFFNNLREVKERYNFLPNQIYNCDETAVTTVHKPPRILAQTGQKQIGKITSGERGTLVTLCVSICANGTFVPPFFIFPRKNFKPHMLTGAPPGSAGAAHSSGWMTATNFELYLDHLIKNTRCSNDNKILLILDNHESHYGIKVLEKAKQNGIILLTIPPHCSHRLQPLDITCFGPFKAFYNRAIDQWLLNHPGTPLTMYDIAGVVGNSFYAAFVPSNITSGFEKTGIEKFNPSVFGEADFLMSYVSDRSVETVANNEQLSPCTSSKTDTSQNTKEMILEKQSETSDKLTTDIEEQLSESKGSTNLHDVGVGNVPSTSKKINILQDVVITPAQVRPHLKAEPRKSTRKGRRRAKSTILTDTPNKSLIEQEHARREEVQKKKLQRTNALKGNKSVTRKIASDTSSEDEANIKSICDDSDSSYVEESLENNNENETISVGDYVLVKYASKRHIQHHVGCVTGRRGCDVVVSFLKRGFKRSFVFPEQKDYDTIDIEAIVSKLPKPHRAGGSKRANEQLIFSYDLAPYNIA